MLFDVLRTVSSLRFSLSSLVDKVIIYAAMQITDVCHQCSLGNYNYTTHKEVFLVVTRIFFISVLPERS